jgi:NAD(P)-dependent dehydrogenase (short-subunit alcohol dehydrogenase family)
MEKSTPWPRIGNAEDIAGVVLLLCLRQSQWITGQVLAIDGAMALRIPL